MATVVQYTVVDDLDASTDRVGTYRFALEGVQYEIDLSEPNLGKLRDAVAPFIAAGRRLPKHKAAPRRGPGTSNGRSTVALIRDWWATHQQELNLPLHKTHGAIPREVRDAFQAAR